jgi:hypothetical protein
MTCGELIEIANFEAIPPKGKRYNRSNHLPIQTLYLSTPYIQVSKGTGTREMQ